MNVFLTGATGFVGKSFVTNLLDVINPNDTIFVLVRKEVEYKDSRIIQLAGSLEDISNFRNDILCCQYVFHMAAIAAFGSALNFDRVNY